MCSLSRKRSTRPKLCGSESFVDNNPYASPTGVETEKTPPSQLGLASMLLSVVAAGLLAWVATRVTVDRSQGRIPIILWHWPGGTGLLLVACFAWLLSLGGFGVGGWTFIKDLKQSRWGKLLGLAGFFLAISNLFLSFMYWGILTED